MCVMVYCVLVDNFLSLFLRLEILLSNKKNENRCQHDCMSWRWMLFLSFSLSLSFLLSWNLVIQQKEWKSVPTWLHAPEMYEGCWHAKVSSSAEMSKELNEGAIIQCYRQHPSQLLHTTFPTQSVKMYVLDNIRMFYL